MTKTQNLTIMSTLRYAFTTYVHHFVLLLCTIFFVEISGALLVSLPIQKPFFTYSTFLLLALRIVTILLYLFLFLGLRQIALDLYYKQKSNFLRLFSCTRTFPTFIAASFLFIVCFSIACALLLVLLMGIAHLFEITDTATQLLAGQSIWELLPVWFIVIAIILLIPLIALVSSILFYPYFILDMKSHAMESIKQSYHAVRPHLGTVMALIIIFALISYTIINPVILFFSDQTVWNILIKLAIGSLFKPVELLSYVYIYVHIKHVLK